MPRLRRARLHWVGLTPAVKNLTVAMILVYLFQRLDMALDWQPGMALSPFEKWFMLTPTDVLHHQTYWQLVTYAFLHGPVWHLVSNLLGFVLIGPEVERTMGARHFYILFFTSAFFAGLGHALLNPAPVVGASGAIFGVLGAMVALYPTRRVFLIFFPWFQFRSFWLVPAMILLHVAFIEQWLHWGLRIAYENHLAGMTAGIAYTLFVFRVLIRKKGQPKPVLPLLVGSGIQIPPHAAADGRFRDVVRRALQDGPESLNDHDFLLLRMIFPGIPPRTPAAKEELP